MSESIVKNKNRVGNYTSSNAYKLIEKGSRPMTAEEKTAHKKANPKSQKRNIDDGFSKGGITYIKQRKQERKRKRSLSLDASSNATAWGDLVEMRVYDIIGIEWSIESKETSVHRKFKNWTGSWDLIQPRKKIGEIKGYYPEKFCDYADALLSKDIKRLRQDFAQEYWQIVSSACIANVPKGEALLYLPYDSEAQEIAELCELHSDHREGWRFKGFYDRIVLGDLYLLPFQPDDSGYPNLVTFEFEIPPLDKKYLEERIVEAEAEIEKL